MLSLRCLISALTQAGGGDLLFRFASSVHSCCGQGGALQTDNAVCGEHSLCSGHTGFAPYRGVCAFPVYAAQAPSCPIWSGPCVACGSFSGNPQKHGLGCTCVLCLPRPERFRQPEAWAPSPRCGAPFPSAARGQLLRTHKLQAPNWRALGPRREKARRTCTRGEGAQASGCPGRSGLGRHKMQAQPNPRFCGVHENWNCTQRRARSAGSREPEQCRRGKHRHPCTGQTQCGRNTGSAPHREHCLPAAPRPPRSRTELI